MYSPTDFTDLHRWLGCLQGGALVSSAPTELRWCTSCYVGALETSAPPEVSSFCVDLCNLWEALCCCGGKDTSATIFRTQTICVDLCNLWEAIPSRRFCEFCAICGRSSPAEASVNSVQSVGGHPQQAEAIRGSLFAATVSRHITNIACYSVRRTARGQTGAGMEQTGAGGEYRALLH